MNFFIESLGFTNEEIILVDRNEFRQEIIEETQKELNDFAERMFEDQEIGLANQVLHIALCESQGNNYHAYNFFSSTSNFELVVDLT